MLVECEPAIKSIIVHLDSENHDIIIEDLDETHLVVKENMVQLLKQKLEDVSSFTSPLLLMSEPIIHNPGAANDWVSTLYYADLPSP